MPGWTWFRPPFFSPQTKFFFKRKKSHPHHHHRLFFWEHYGRSHTHTHTPLLLRQNKHQQPNSDLILTSCCSVVVVVDDRRLEKENNNSWKLVVLKIVSPNEDKNQKRKWAGKFFSFLSFPTFFYWIVLCVCWSICGHRLAFVWFGLRFVKCQYNIRGRFFVYTSFTTGLGIESLCTPTGNLIWYLLVSLFIQTLGRWLIHRVKTTDNCGHHHRVFVFFRWRHHHAVVPQKKRNRRQVLRRSPQRNPHRLIRHPILLHSAMELNFSSASSSVWSVVFEEKNSVAVISFFYILCAFFRLISCALDWSSQRPAFSIPTLWSWLIETTMAHCCSKSET